MRRTIAFVMCLVIVISAMSLSAFAGSQTKSGTYNSYNYSCTLSRYVSSASASMTYGSNTSTISTSGYVVAENVYSGDSYQASLSTSGTHSISKSASPRTNYRFTSATCSYYVGSSKVCSIGPL